MKREIDIAQHERSDVDEPATFEDEEEAAAEVTAHEAGAEQHERGPVEFRRAGLTALGLLALLNIANVVITRLLPLAFAERPRHSDLPTILRPSEWRPTVRRYASCRM